MVKFSIYLNRCVFVMWGWGYSIYMYMLSYQCVLNISYLSQLIIHPYGDHWLPCSFKESRNIVEFTGDKQCSCRFWPSLFLHSKVQSAVKNVFNYRSSSLKLHRLLQMVINELELPRIQPLPISGQIQQTSNWLCFFTFSQKIGLDISCRFSPFTI